MLMMITTEPTTLHPQVVGHTFLSQTLSELKRHFLHSERYTYIGLGLMTIWGGNWSLISSLFYVTWLHLSTQALLYKATPPWIDRIGLTGSATIGHSWNCLGGTKPSMWFSFCLDIQLLHIKVCSKMHTRCLLIHRNIILQNIITLLGLIWIYSNCNQCVASPTSVLSSSSQERCSIFFMAVWILLWIWADNIR